MIHRFGDAACQLLAVDIHRGLLVLNSRSIRAEFLTHTIDGVQHGLISSLDIALVLTEHGIRRDNLSDTGDASIHRSNARVSSGDYVGKLLILKFDVRSVDDRIDRWSLLDVRRHLLADYIHGGTNRTDRGIGQRHGRSNNEFLGSIHADGETFTDELTDLHEYS